MRREEPPALEGGHRDAVVRPRTPHRPEEGVREHHSRAGAAAGVAPQRRTQQPRTESRQNRTATATATATATGRRRRRRRRRRGRRRTLTSAAVLRSPLRPCIRGIEVPVHAIALHVPVVPTIGKLYRDVIDLVVVVVASFPVVFFVQSSELEGHSADEALVKHHSKAPHVRRA